MILQQLNRIRSLLIVAILVNGTAGAQLYPAKPVRMLVPFPPGGGTDYIARLLGRDLSEIWGQTVLIENRPGASMMIASEIVAKAPPDGYTIIMSSSNHTINPSLYSKIPYDTVKDFAAVTQVATSPFVLVTHPSLPVKSVKELIALARARKGQLTYASSGTGSVVHLGMEMFKSMAGVPMTHIPYKGSCQSMVDVIGGRVQLAITNSLTATPLVRTGKLRALAVTGAKRSNSFADLPTIAEAGVPGFELTSWYGVFTPTKTPMPIVRIINRDITDIMNTPEMKEKLTADAAEPPPA